MTAVILLALMAMLLVGIVIGICIGGSCEAEHYERVIDRMRAYPRIGASPESEGPAKRAKEPAGVTRAEHALSVRSINLRLEKLEGER